MKVFNTTIPMNPIFKYVFGIRSIAVLVPMFVAPAESHKARNPATVPESHPRTVGVDLVSSVSLFTATHPRS